MKLALCNEVLRHLSWEAQCQHAAALGFDGLEIAPFTFADDPRTLHAARYTGWMAVEPFDYHPDPAACAAYSAGYVRGILETLQ